MTFKSLITGNYAEIHISFRCVSCFLEYIYIQLAYITLCHYFLCCKGKTNSSNDAYYTSLQVVYKRLKYVVN